MNIFLFCVVSSTLVTLSTLFKVKGPYFENQINKCMVALLTMPFGRCIHV